MTDDDDSNRNPSAKVFVYRGNVPMWIGLLIAAPLLLLALSVVAALAVGGAIAALLLPLVFRRRLRTARRDDSIELQAGEYHHIEESVRQLPDDKA